jgi:hypothetical protein
VCPHASVYASACYCIGVLMLLCICGSRRTPPRPHAHTTTYASACYYMCPDATIYLWQPPHAAAPSRRAIREHRQRSSRGIRMRMPLARSRSCPSRGGGGVALLGGGAGRRSTMRLTRSSVKWMTLVPLTSATSSSRNEDNIVGVEVMRTHVVVARTALVL